jgi:hypothetical protein
MFTSIVLFILIGITLETIREASKTPGMARITLGSVVNSISGSVDQLVYSTWKGINYIRSKAKTISNPQSESQMDVRSRVAECSKYWNDTLTQAERNNWETYANSIVIPSSGPGDIIKPAKGPFSGYTAFLRNNILKFTSGQVALGVFQTLAPIGVTPPDAPVAVAAGWVLNTLKVSWTPGVIPGTNVATWTREQSGMFHAQQINSTPVGAGISSAASVNGAQGKAVALTSVRAKFDCQVMVVDQFGQPSPASTLVKGIDVTGI